MASGTEEKGVSQQPERIEQAEAESHDYLSDADLKGRLDLGAQALKGQRLTYTSEEGRRVLRKIDWHILPLAAWACGLQFVDKSGLGSAATYGLREDLGLHGQEYSWCVSIFYFGYLGGAAISGRLLQCFHAGRVIGIAFFLWGCTLLGCIGVKNYADLLVLRFLLGWVKRSLLGMDSRITKLNVVQYTHREQPLRSGIWTVTNGALPVPFLVIYYVFWCLDVFADTKTSQKSWKLIFLLIGLLSCLTGVALYFFIPNTPATAPWLNERERAIAVQRVAED
ncbi:uncharacterized protein Z518_03585 [Rhinocladiella mackenziei CBS 650.93]|uniref:Major facilitator superfamily (MFS) profile domain-containing protein n=1 Tax=Rhinocladiella mackenziei CBS 650.93 TaxID=1442369 RepID=A0A0D2H5C8_9EURO|nr:uncharacterized protein Z518_03585 [Rhinocladiella mackenziei CBS 650.93]KIX05613.1 hypothetical protein Z518_03585 [Rhinocladiella mackenziei CBS 650.93]